MTHYDLDQENTHESTEVNNNQEPFDLQHELDGTYYNQEKYGNRYYREFNLKKLIPQKFPEYEENSRKFSEILEQILSDPCNVVIGDLNLELDSYNSDLITAELPIQYSMRNFLSQELIRDLPHEKYLAENDNVILQFSSHDFIFDAKLMEISQRLLPDSYWRMMPITLLFGLLLSPHRLKKAFQLTRKKKD
mgnify:CR=1 FL=1